MRQTTGAKQPRKSWELEASGSVEAELQGASKHQRTRTGKTIKSDCGPSFALPAQRVRQILLPYSNCGWEISRKVEM